MDYEVFRVKCSDVLAVMVHYKRLEYTIPCLHSLQCQTTLVDILIIDNGSEDGSWELIQRELREHDELEVIVDASSYACAVNRGLRLAQARAYKYVFLCGNDTVVREDCLSELVRAFDGAGEVGAVGAVIVEMGQEETVQSAGGNLDRRTWFTYHRLEGTPVSKIEQSDLAKPDWLDFAAVLISMTTVGRVGLLDEAYQFYWEDVDWSLRCIEQGLRLDVCANAIVAHKGSATSGRQSDFYKYMITRNKYESAKKFRSKLFVTSLWLHEYIQLRFYDKTDGGNAVKVRALWDFALRRTYYRPS